MASHVEISQKENVTLKDEKERLAKQTRQKKPDDQIAPLSQVCTRIAVYSNNNFMLFTISILSDTIK